MKLLYTGPFINVELLIVMLEKHGIQSTHEFENATDPDDDELNRVTRVYVAEGDYERAHRLFFADREDEI